MSIPSAPSAVSEPLVSTGRPGPGTIAYRLAVLVMLGIGVWFLRQLAQPRNTAGKPAFALVGQTWRREYDFDKERRYAEMEFRADGTIRQRGSGQGKFEILSSNEVSIDPTSDSGGLFGWPEGGQAARWSVEMVGDDLLLERQLGAKDRMVLHKVTKLEEQNEAILRAFQQLQIQSGTLGASRQMQNDAILRELQGIRTEARKRAAAEEKK